MPQVRVGGYYRDGQYVEGYSRTGKRRKRKPTAVKKVRVRKKEDENKKRRKKESGINPAIPVAGVLIGASLLGVSAGAYLGLRSNYRAALPGNVSKVRESMQKYIGGDPAKRAISLSNKNYDHVVFTVGGFDSTGKGSKALAEKLQGKIPRAHVVPVDQMFNLPARAKKSNTDFAVEALKKTLSTTLRGKGNPAAIELAAEVAAWAEANPTKSMTVVGHSAGGIVGREAMEYLKLMGIKNHISLVTLGTPHAGINKQVAPTLSLGSTADPIVSMMPTAGTKNMPKVKGHTIEEYFENEDVTNEIISYVRGGSKKESERKAKFYSPRQDLLELTKYVTCFS